DGAHGLAGPIEVRTAAFEFEVSSRRGHAGVLIDFGLDMFSRFTLIFRVLYLEAPHGIGPARPARASAGPALRPLRRRARRAPRGAAPRLLALGHHHTGGVLADRLRATVVWRVLGGDGPD